MSEEISCVIVKPDGVGKAVVGQVVDRFEREGFRLDALRMIRPTAERMGAFYGEHKGKPFYEGLLVFITSGPVVVMAWRGDNAVAKIRQIVGATNPAQAVPGTLRAQWGTDNRRNLVHASDSISSGQRETAFFFTPDELLPYNPHRWTEST